MKLESEAYYMDINGGAVLTGAEWLQDQKDEGYPESDFECLREVRKPLSAEEEEQFGEWVEVK